MPLLLILDPHTKKILESSPLIYVIHIYGNIML